MSGATIAAVSAGATLVGGAPALAAGRTVTHGYHAQERSYWRGPATLRMAASCRGASITQADAAAFMGTTAEKGTSLEALTRGLDQFVPDSDYRIESFWRDSDWMSRREISQMVSRIRQNVDDGYGTVLNWNVLPGRYPGFANKGPIAHHVLCDGHDAGKRTLRVADPAAHMFGLAETSWIPVSTVVGFVARRGYAW